MSEKYAFIDAEYAETRCAGGAGPTMTAMLAWLGVSKSGYYEWLRRGPSDAELRREDLKVKITKHFDAEGGRYGYRRIHALLVRQGEIVDDETVRKLMRELGLVAVQPKPFRRTTLQDDTEAKVPDRVQRDFTADRPGAKLVGDITYIHTWEGWLFLATVIDCFNREVIGWAMADHMRTSLVTDALEMAARNHTLEPKCIMHTDRGSQYTSEDYAKKIAELDLLASLGKTGVCWDNALAESFFASLKNERVHLMTYATRKKAAADIAWYIEMHYNSKRLHSTLGYRTPREIRNQFTRSLEAA